MSADAAVPLATPSAEPAAPPIDEKKGIRLQSLNKWWIIAVVIVLVIVFVVNWWKTDEDDDEDEVPDDQYVEFYVERILEKQKKNRPLDD